jgi:pimeloyl-ACP methyl ester carboxylesterase
MRFLRHYKAGIFERTKQMKKIFCLAFILLFSISIYAADQNGAFAEFEGNRVYFKNFGKGKKAIVFVHGWTCNSDFWRDSFTAFPGYRVIAVDLPGHGQSDKPQVAYTMDYFARSIEAVMKNAKVEKAVLVGHSMGTPVIRQFYRLYPKKTLGLVIVDGSLRGGTKAEMDQLIVPLRANYRENAARFVDGMLQPIQDEKLRQEIRAAMLSTPEYVGLSAMEGMADEKIWTDDKINVPVLAILAESPWWKSDTDDFYKKIAPTIDFRMWQGVSHFLMMEKPQLFNKSVLLYLNLNKLL